MSGTISVSEESVKDNFSGIGVQDGFELYLINKDTVSTVKIEADENVILHVKYEIKNGILYFYKEKETEFSSDALVKISVIKDSVRFIKAANSKIYISDTLRNDTIELNCSDKSILEGRIECINLKSSIGNSSLKLTGTTNKLFMNIFSGSIIDSFGLESENIKVNIAGGSVANLTVVKELELQATEHSILNYKGNPVIRNMVLMDDSKINNNN
jgi:hypothetical protein